MSNQILEHPIFPFRVELQSLSLGKLLRQQMLGLLPRLEPKLDSLEYLEEQISLYRLKNDAEIIYRSRFPFQLSKHYLLPPEEICQQLLLNLASLSFDGLSKQFNQSSEQLYSSPYLEFEVRAINPGWLEFQLSDCALAVWLQQLPQMIIIPSPAGKEKIKQDYANLFPLQYVHARCCSLLRLGHREGLIKLKSEALAQPVWQWQQPHPIPWFKPNPKPGKFQLVHPRERRLIHQLVTVVEAGESLVQPDWVQLATALSQAFLDFYRSCRVWGEVKQENPELACARLGLIALTQFVLRALLQEQVRVSALVEL